jgi:hypothetical protein
LRRVEDSVGIPDEDEAEAGSDFADEAPEFADESTGGDSDEYAGPSPSESDSDIGYAAEAATDDDLYEADQDQGADASHLDIADDAGSGAGYGFEAVVATSDFSGGDESGFDDDSGMTEDVDEYQMTDTTPEKLDYDDEASGGVVDDDYAEPAFDDDPEGDAAVTGFAEEANTSDGPAFAPDLADEDAGYGADYENPEDATDSSGSGGYADDDGDGYADSDGDGYADSSDAGYGDEDSDQEAVGFTFSQPEPEPEAEAEPEAEPEAEAEAESESDDDDDKSGRSGQVAKSALDEIFARAAQLKRRT